MMWYVVYYRYMMKSELIVSVYSVSIADRMYSYLLHYQLFLGTWPITVILIPHCTYIHTVVVPSAAEVTPHTAVGKYVLFLLSPSSFI